MRFKIPIDKGIYEKVKNLSKTKLIWEEEEDTQERVLIYSNPEIEENGYKIYVQAKDYDHLFTEFSVPKVLLGTNIFLVYPDKVAKALDIAQKTIENHYDIKLLNNFAWIVQRVDYCYAWKFEEDYTDQWIIEQLYKFTYPRKEPTKRNTSISWGGSTEKIQFYLKHPEVLDSKEYKKLKKENPALAEFYDQQSKNVLRHEITRRKSKLNNLFGGEVNYKTVVNENLIINTLNETIKTLTNTEQIISMEYKEAVDRLYATYDSVKANRLIQFMYAFYFTNPAIMKLNQKLLKDKSNSTTISRNLKDLREAGVGFLVEGSKHPQINLTIPSPNVINTQDKFAEIAEAISKLRVTTTALD